MQTSSPTSPRPRQPKQILLIGVPGCGKSTFMLTFPHLSVLDADLNLAGPEERLRAQEKTKTLSYKYCSILQDDEGKEIPEDQRFDRLLRQFDLAKNDEWTKTIGTDSLTHLQQYLLWQIQAKTKSPSMEIKDWGVHRGAMMSFLCKQKNAKKDVILICHRYDKTKKKGEKSLEEEVIGYVPAINPGMQEDLGAMFTDIWHVRMELRAGNQYENWIDTTPIPMMRYLKNSLGMDAQVNVTNGFSAITKWWKD